MVDPRTHESRGFGFVSFETAEQAAQAIASLNTRVVSGRPLHVSLAQTKTERMATMNTVTARTLPLPCLPLPCLPLPSSSLCWPLPF